MFGVGRLLAKAFGVERLRSDSEGNRTPESKRPRPNAEAVLKVGQPFPGSHAIS